MADIKISELTAVSSLNNDDLVEVSQVNALAPSGYTSLKATMRDLGSKVNKDIEYTTDLADFGDKTTLGAIKETAKDKNVADEYDGTQTYDKGDVVIYKNTLYICTTNNTTGTWDATKWTATTVQSLIGSLSTLTTTDTSSLVGAVNEVNGKTEPTFSSFSGTSAVKDIEYMQVCKIGKICIVSAKFTINGAITGGVKSLFTGLPTATNNRWIFPASVLTGTDIDKTRRLSVNSSGGIDAYYDNFYDNEQIYFHSVYVSTT